MRHVRQIRLRTQPAANHDLETARFDAVLHLYLRDETQIVHERETGVAVAAGKRDFELAPQFLADGVAQEIPEHRIGIRRHVKRLFGVNAGCG